MLYSRVAKDLATKSLLTDQRQREVLNAHVFTAKLIRFDCGASEDTLCTHARLHWAILGELTLRGHRSA